MAVATVSVLVTGNNLRLADDVLGISTVALVEAGGTRILVDAGGPSTRGALRRGLRERGLAPEDVDAVFLTHLHWDHAWNLDLFPRARVIVPAAELAYAAAPHPDDAYVMPGILDRLAALGAETCTGGALAPGVEAIAAPGHTPGLHAVLVETDGGPLLIASDAIKYPKEAMAGACDMAFDAAATGGATIRRLTAMAERIVPGHFPEIRRTAGGWTWDGAAEMTLVLR